MTHNGVIFLLGISISIEFNLFFFVVGPLKDFFRWKQHT